MFPQAAEQSLLDSTVVAAAAPGGIMAISVYGDWPTILVTGTSDPKVETPIKPDDVAYIASITKTFTAAVLLQLVSEGKVSLDVPINTYGLNFPHGDVITVRQLLTHASGIAGEGLEEAASNKQYDSEELARILHDQSHAFTSAEVIAWVRDRSRLHRRAAAPNPRAPGPVEGLLLRIAKACVTTRPGGLRLIPGGPNRPLESLPEHGRRQRHINTHPFGSGWGDGVQRRRHNYVGQRVASDWGGARAGDDR